MNKMIATWPRYYWYGQAKGKMEKETFKCKLIMLKQQTYYIGTRRNRSNHSIQYVHEVLYNAALTLHKLKPTDKYTNLTKTKIWNSIVRADEMKSLIN